jgi:F420-non-reducing hydrogenase iron-sulfur subunit
MGMEPGRLHFSWISSAEAGKFVDTVQEITEEVAKLGPATRLIKGMPVLPEDGGRSEQPARTGEQ